MPVNQLYHDRGVALTQAHHAGGTSPGDGQPANALLGHPFGEKQAGRIAAEKIDGDRFEIFRAEEVQVSSTQFAGGTGTGALRTPPMKRWSKGVVIERKKSV